MEKTPSKYGAGFKLASAMLIAVVAVVSAAVAAHAALLSVDADSMDSDGLDAVLNVAAVRTLNAANLYQHYTAYTDYARYKELGHLLSGEFEEQLFGTDDADRDPLVRELSDRREEAYDLAGTSQFFFVTRYLDQGGGYDLERESGEAWAEAARWVDLDPAAHFAQADQVREKSRRLVGTLIVFAVALWFYTLASTIKHPLKYVPGVIGLCTFLAGVVWVIRVEGWL
jgi:hypothetical protein